MKFYTPDTNYMVAFMKDSIPEMPEESIIDLKKLSNEKLSTDDVFDKSFQEDQIRKSKSSHFKVYLKERNSTVMVAERTAASEYEAISAFADDFRMIGLIRKSE